MKSPLYNLRYELGTWTEITEQEKILRVVPIGDEVLVKMKNGDRPVIKIADSSALMCVMDGGMKKWYSYSTLTCRAIYTLEKLLG
jgi:hypothetical protein